MVVCLLLGNFGNLASAEDKIDFKVALFKLEKERDRNLESIKEQLEEQDMMEHYIFYEELISLEYNMLKNKIEGKNISTYMNDLKYTLPYGGQIQYRVEPSSDSRSHAFIAIDSYTKSQTYAMFEEYKRGFIPSFKDLSLFAAAVIGAKLYPGLSPLIIGMQGSVLVKNYLTVNKIAEIENSASKSLQIVSVSTSGGKSTTWKEWSDNPYVYIHNDAVKVNIIQF